MGGLQAAVWAMEEGDAESVKLANRLGIPLLVQESAPQSPPWLLFFEGDELFLHSTELDYKPLSVNYLKGEFAKRWQKISRNDLLLKAVGLKKGVRTVCDPTCGLGYDAFLLATVDGLEVTACERNPIVAELTMNALLRVKENGRFEEFPLYFYFGDGKEFLEGRSFDAVVIDPMYPREEAQAKQRKEMFLLRELVGSDQDAEALFQAAWKAATKRVVVKRPDRAAPLAVGKKPDASIDGSTIRYDIYLKN